MTTKQDETHGSDFIHCYDPAPAGSGIRRTGYLPEQTLLHAASAHLGVCRSGNLPDDASAKAGTFVSGNFVSGHCVSGHCVSGHFWVQVFLGPDFCGLSNRRAEPEYKSEIGYLSATIIRYRIKRKAFRHSLMSRESFSSKSISLGTKALFPQTVSSRGLFDVGYAA